MKNDNCTEIENFFNSYSEKDLLTYYKLYEIKRKRTNIAIVVSVIIWFICVTLIWTLISDVKEQFQDNKFIFFINISITVLLALIIAFGPAILYYKLKASNYLMMRNGSYENKKLYQRYVYDNEFNYEKISYEELKDDFKYWYKIIFTDKKK